MSPLAVEASFTSIPVAAVATFWSNENGLGETSFKVPVTRVLSLAPPRPRSTAEPITLVIRPSSPSFDTRRSVNPLRDCRFSIVISSPSLSNRTTLLALELAVTPVEPEIWFMASTADSTSPLETTKFPVV